MISTKNWVCRLINEGHECVVYNRHAQAVKVLQGRGAVVASSLADRVARLTVPRVAGLMVPAALSPGIGAAPRTPVRQGRDGTAERSYLHCGRQGTGHFVRMVHNGIGHGVMAAYVEGLNILRNADAGKRARESDAGSTPLRSPEHDLCELDLPAIAEISRRGSVIGSWLPDLTAAALVNDRDVNDYAGRVSDSGEGRWTIAAAVDEAVPVPAPGAVLHERFNSRGDVDFANRGLSAMLEQFGGHDEKKRAKS